MFPKYHLFRIYNLIRLYKPLRVIPAASININNHRNKKKKILNKSFSRFGQNMEKTTENHTNNSKIK